MTIRNPPVVERAPAFGFHITSTVEVRRSPPLRLRRYALLAPIVLASVLIFCITRNANAQVSPARSIAYSYELTTNFRPDTCKQMEVVLNKRFRNVWDVPEGLRFEDLTPDSEFVFKRLPGAEEDKRLAFQIVNSKLPSSPEFDAIEWSEGRVINGGPPGVTMSGSTTSLPALVAYADVDNDGMVDTLIRHGFMEGYRAMRIGRLGAEYLLTLRGKQVEVKKDASLWELRRSLYPEPQSLSINGSYLRLFTYKGLTYLLAYDMQLNYEGRDKGPFPVRSETMRILELRYAGEKSPYTGAPAWSQTVTCQYQMNQVLETSK